MNLGNIELPTDAVSARMVEAGWKFLKGEVLLKNGDTVIDGRFNLDYHWIVNVDLPVHSNDAANKKYVDGQIPKSIITIIAERRGPLGGSEFQLSEKENMLDMSLSAAQRNGIRRRG